MMIFSKKKAAALFGFAWIGHGMPWM